MGERALEQRVENLERQATAVSPLATTVDVKAVIKAEEEATRRHVDVVAEGLRTDIRLIAEKLDATESKADARHADVMRILTQHDRRLMRLEASSPSQL